MSFSKNLDVLTQVRRINKQLNSVVAKCEAPVGDTMVVQASLLASEQRSLVAVGNDEKAGAAKASIRVEMGKSTGKKAIVVEIKAGGPTTTKDGFDYVRGLEFSTQDMPAQPFFFPPYRARRKAIRAATKKAVKLAVRDVFK